MSTTNHDDTGRSTVRSFLPRSQLFWVGFGLAVVFLFVGGVVVTGPLAAMMGVWGTTVLLITVVGYAVYRLWYTFGA